MSAVALRKYHDAASLRSLAKASKSPGGTRRLLALAAIYDGGSRTDAARIGAVGLQTVRDWVLRFNARGPEGLVDGKAPGPKSKLDDEHRRALVAKIEAGPIPAVDGVVRWRLIDLAQWIFEEYGISVTKQILSRELRAMGYRSSRRVPVITRKTRRLRTFLKRFPCRRSSRRREDRRQADRDLVSG